MVVNNGLRHPLGLPDGLMCHPGGRFEQLSQVVGVGSREAAVDARGTPSMLGRCVALVGRMSREGPRLDNAAVLGDLKRLIYEEKGSATPIRARYSAREGSRNARF